MPGNAYFSNNFRILTFWRGKFVSKMEIISLLTFGAVPRSLQFSAPASHIYAFPFSFVHCLLSLQIFNIFLCIQIFQHSPPAQRLQVGNFRGLGTGRMGHNSQLKNISKFQLKISQFQKCGWGYEGMWVWGLWGTLKSSNSYWCWTAELHRLLAWVQEDKKVPNIKISNNLRLFC